MLKRRVGAALRGFRDPSRVLYGNQGAQFLEMRQIERLHRDGPDRWQRVFNICNDALAKSGVSAGRMLEIGGRQAPRNEEFPQFLYSAMDLDPAKGSDRVDVTVGNITNCPEIPDGSFDFIFSLDVFEHIDKPWLAAQEIERILKPGGVTVHSTLFSWRYHPCPIDYWRYTPLGLASLFGGLKELHADFDWTERRRNVTGVDGNAMMPDAFGGWRENVRVNFAGHKPI